MQRIAECGRGAPLDDLEATQPYISAPWDARPGTIDGTDDGLQAAARAQETHGIRIVTSASVFELGQRAKQLAKRSTDEGQVASDRPRLTKRIVLKSQQLLAQAMVQIPTTVGDAVRRIDAAWPGSHTRRMYDELSKRQASVVAQLRTGMTPLNGYLHNIKAVESNLCECGEAVESREHFTFHCVRWSEQREILDIRTGEEDLSRLLGGKTTTDNDDWTPDMDAHASANDDDDDDEVYSARR
ncbi:hypothetical protein D6C77_09455 [Aureobasidium pullulans]|nr:hypothetical protein D6C77_09455 [Aureobasidium pullulans]